MSNVTAQLCQVDPIEINNFWKNGLSILYSLVGVFALIGNVVVILIVLCRRPMQTVPNLFICSLSLADIASRSSHRKEDQFQIIALSSLWATPMYFYLKTWLWGQSMCYLVYAVQGASLMWVSYTLTALAIDRYRMVVSPFCRRISISTCFLSILGTWMFSLFVLSPMLYHVVYVEFPCHKFCFEDWRPHNGFRLYYGIMVLIVRSVIPLFVIGWCNWKIARKLNDQRKRFSGTNRLRHTEVCRKQRLQNILKGMVVIFAVSSVPLDAFNVIQDFSIVWRTKIIDDEYGNLVFLFSHWSAMSGTLLNPLIYAYWNENFRRQAALFFGRQKASFTEIFESIASHSVVHKQTSVILHETVAL